MVPAYELPQWLEETDSGVILQVKVTPNGTRNRVSGQLGASLLITLTAPEQDGKANGLLIKFLSDSLGVATAQLNVVAGGSGKIKKVLIDAVRPSQVSMRLSPR